MAKIMIDPGHAPGNANHGPTGYYEYAGMWALSNHLKTALTRCGHTAGLTRNEGDCPELTARGNAAAGCDVFISEHSNAGGGSARGCMAFYSVRIPTDEPFAAELAAAAAGVMGNSNRGAVTKKSTNDPSYDYFTVIGYAVASGCPHVFLCETGFHDNAEDEAVLKSDAKLKEIAEAQARVICARLGATYVDESSPVPAPTPAPTPTLVPMPVPTQANGFAVGSMVRVRDGVTTFADGTGMASFVRSSTLYVRQIGEGKALISTQADGAVTGWVRKCDLVCEDGNAVTPAPNSQPAPEPTPEPAPTALAVGDTVRIRDGVTAFADGTGMASFVRTAVLYVRYLGVGKVLISTQSDGAVTGWVRLDDVVRT